MVTFVDITVTSDLFLTGYLDFGTDTMYEDASYLQVTGSKAVRFGQNIGNANWTVYNAAARRSAVTWTLLAAATSTSPVAGWRWRRAQNER